ncbi:hypothetical protein [Pectobacterium parmentieri]|uniref:hypothetical protein n=1 Tax=Pectobacterium parmentieri TaxID=1905730 RepID=UPI00235112D6|nr:hypothetical protein [Pectobacterium parmentieri]
MQANDGAIEWYSEINGQPIRLTDLPTSERMRAEALLTQKQHIISELKNKLAQDRRVSEDVLRMLTLASQQPADSSIWVIGDQPVITELSPPPIIAVAPSSRLDASGGRGYCCCYCWLFWLYSYYAVVCLWHQQSLHSHLSQSHQQSPSRPKNLYNQPNPLRP